MIWIELETASTEPVSLAELKTFLRLDRDDEDALAGTCLRAARQAVEAETGLVLTERRVRLAFEVEPTQDEIAIRRRPVRSLLGAVGYDEGGVATPLDIASFHLEAMPFGARLILPPGLAHRARNGVEVEIRVGQAKAEVPDALKLAIIRLAAASFETRGAVGSGLQPAFMPPLARALMSPFRAPRL
ncbi:head-tail connector protein [Aureimonas ureilytica]|uniref:head-tail connector protein n=1 Tax=Aureimonas ureilytica TaxID=401562 RepID=UPI000733FFE2|nr:phage head-tail connector protein [Aureimonas ureilytica]